MFFFRSLTFSLKMINSDSSNGGESSVTVKKGTKTFSKISKQVSKKGWTEILRLCLMDAVESCTKQHRYTGEIKPIRFG